MNGLKKTYSAMLAVLLALAPVLADAQVAATQVADRADGKYGFERTISREAPDGMGDEDTIRDIWKTGRTSKR